VLLVALFAACGWRLRSAYARVQPSPPRASSPSTSRGAVIRLARLEAAPALEPGSTDSLLHDCITPGHNGALTRCLSSDRERVRTQQERATAAYNPAPASDVPVASSDSGGASLISAGEDSVTDYRAEVRRLREDVARLQASAAWVPPTASPVLPPPEYSPRADINVVEPLVPRTGKSGRRG
jgi:hypothetical protein